MSLKRPICKECNKNYCSINYTRNSKVYYRSRCGYCRKKQVKRKPLVQSWEKAGYQKKPHCDLCGFKSLYLTQMTVFYIDGDLTNAAFSNLRTICLNCIEVVKRKEVTWKRGDLTVDY